MEVTAAIDVTVKDDVHTLRLSNWDDSVKIDADFLKAPIYVNRADLIQALCALDVGNG